MIYLFVKNEKSVQTELKNKGMTFVEVDKDAFGEKCRETIYNSLSPEMKEVYNDIQKIKSQRNE